MRETKIVAVELGDGAGMGATCPYCNTRHPVVQNSYTTTDSEGQAHAVITIATATHCKHLFDVVKGDWLGAAFVVFIADPEEAVASTEEQPTAPGV